MSNPEQKESRLRLDAPVLIPDRDLLVRLCEESVRTRPRGRTDSSVVMARLAPWRPALAAAVAAVVVAGSTVVATTMDRNSPAPARPAPATPVAPTPSIQEPDGRGPATERRSTDRAESDESPAAGTTSPPDSVGGVDGAQDDGTRSSDFGGDHSPEHGEHFGDGPFGDHEQQSTYDGGDRDDGRGDDGRGDGGLGDRDGWGDVGADYGSGSDADTFGPGGTRDGPGPG